MIVILALIALISIPIILNIIEKTRKSAFKDSAYGIMESAKVKFTEAMLDGITEPTYFEYPFDDLEFNGTKPKGGMITINKNGLISLALHNNKWCAIKNADENEIKMIAYDENTCKPEDLEIPDQPVSGNPPMITVPENTIVKVTEVTGYNLLTGVIVTDKNGKSLVPQISGSLSAIPGEYTITYIAIDDDGIEANKERKITVVEADGPILNLSMISTNDNWTQSQTITVTASDNSNLELFTYEIIKNGTSEGVIPVTVSGKSVSTDIILNTDGEYSINLNAIDEYGTNNHLSSGIYQIDVTPPTPGTATFTGTLGNNGWYISDVIVNVEDGSDDLSGHASTSSNVSSITSDTTGTNVIITTTDNAGNEETNTYIIKRDAKAPTPGTATFTGTLGNNGWYISDVIVNVEDGSDDLSGHASTTINIDSINSYTAGTNVVVTTTDNAGNEKKRNYTIKMDKQDPKITMSDVTINTNEVIDYDLMTGVTVEDDSGVPPTVATSGNLSAIVGEYTITYTVTDQAGNTKEQNRIITVIEPSGKTGAELVVDNPDVASLDADSNPRFVGGNPSNYVNFGNDLYRIIGVFDNQMKIIYWGNKENPGNSYGGSRVQFDPASADGGHGLYGSNDWSQSTLQKTLNTTYWNTIPATYQAMVDQDHEWNLGGTTSYNSATRVNFYSAEIRTSSTTWKGKVGLLYPSDYGYATNNSCDDTAMAHWTELRSEYAAKNCSSADVNWISSGRLAQWTLTPQSGNSSEVYYVAPTDRVYMTDAEDSNGARPVMFLKPNVKVSGAGTLEEPFELSL